MDRPSSKSDVDANGRADSASVDLDIDLDLDDPPQVQAGALTAHAIAAAVSEIMASAPPPPPSSPPIDLKKLAKKNWLANSLIALIVAGAGAVAAYKATESRSLENHENVEKNAKAIQGNSEAIGEVTKSVDTLVGTVDDGRAEQKILIRGVADLKLEAQTEKQKRLLDELAELKRKNRILENRNR